MNGIKFIKENGGLGRKLSGDTHVSGLLVYGEAPFNISAVYSIKELEDLGVNKNSVLHYQASEFFRINQGAKLYCQSVASSDGLFTEVKNMLSFSNGSIRQIAICDFKTPVSKLIETTKALEKHATYFWNKNTPVNFLLSVKVSSTDLATLANLREQKCENVSVVIGQDGGGRGSYLAKTTPSISCIGAVLGSLSKSNVHESIAWVERQNLVTEDPYDKKLTGGSILARELDEPAICDGSLVSSFTDDQLGQFDEKGYLFAIKHVGVAGSFLNDSHTATSLDSDYAYIENGRTISEAVRKINRALIPKVSSPTYVDATTGELDPTTVSGLEALCDQQLDEMIVKGQISGYSVSINPNQKILTSSKLRIVLKIVPVGTLREIEVSIGLTLKN